MAKEQNLSLNLSKISGCCGRLMCCLKYENDVYEEKLSRLPCCGAIVETPDGIGEIEVVETLAERVKVKIKKDDIITTKKYNVKDIKVIKDGTNDKSQQEEENHELKELERLEKLDEEELKGGESYGI